MKELIAKKAKLMNDFMEWDKIEASSYKSSIMKLILAKVKLLEKQIGAPNETVIW